MWLRLALALALLALAGWAVSAHSTAILGWAMAAQREFQNAMATGLRAVQAGDALALLALCAATFAYGVVHALGPGHGKILLGATAVASQATLRRMVVLSVVSALAQSLTAIAVVVVLVVGLSVLDSSGAVDLAEDWLSPLSYALFLLIGAMITMRGLRILLGLRAPEASRDHSCGHGHGPTPEQVETLGSFRDRAALVASIAVRPCTGALFLMVIAAGLDILWAGIFGTLAMGLGTASFNALVAASGVLARRLAQSGDSRTVRITAGVLHVTGGAVIAVLSLVFLIPAL